jgi:hypothetical protein
MRANAVVDMLAMRPVGCVTLRRVRSQAREGGHGAIHVERAWAVVAARQFERRV